MLKKLRSLFKKDSSQWLEDSFETMVKHFAKLLLSGTEQERTKATETLFALTSICAIGELVRGPFFPSTNLAIELSDKAVSLIREEYPEMMSTLAKKRQKAQESFFEQVAQSIPKKQSDVPIN